MKKVSMSGNLSWDAIAKRLVLAIAVVASLFVADVAACAPASAYPFWAQQDYDVPREPTGRIVCANCHLAEAPAKVEVPQSVKPDTVFEAVVEIPYEEGAQQILGDGSKGPLNVGAVLMLPEGFKIAPSERLSEELEEKVEGIYFQPYSEDQQNIVLVGPIPGEDHREITFPVLSPDPNAERDVYFGKYPVYLGANRGRGQLYPGGAKSNNNVFKASAAGTITTINEPEYGGYEVTIETADGDTVVDTIPAGPELIVSEGQQVESEEALTNNPNVGGFGQMDTEIVLQSPARIKGMLAFFAIVVVAQILLILKKKQIEKVQMAEMNF
jgi:apocytochrome f